MSSDSIISIEPEISYLGPDRRETLDVYLPPARFPRPLPAVVHIHGGAWTAGDKASEREQGIGRALAEAGYAVFSINYLLNVESGRSPDGERIFHSFAWPRNLFDCKEAVRFVRRNAERFGVDAGRVAVMGCSAGGHLAMMVGTTTGLPELTAPGEMDEPVRCIVNFYGPYDLSRGFASYFPAGKAEAASPRAYLHAAMPPLLLSHGTADDIVPVELARDLVEEVKALGVECRYDELQDAPHTYGIASPHGDLRPAVLEFLKTHLAHLAHSG